MSGAPVSVSSLPAGSASKEAGPDHPVDPLEGPAPKSPEADASGTKIDVSSKNPSGTARVLRNRKDRSKGGKKAKGKDKESSKSPSPKDPSLGKGSARDSHDPLEDELERMSFLSPIAEDPAPGGWRIHRLGQGPMFPDVAGQSSADQALREALEEQRRGMIRRETERIRMAEERANHEHRLATSEHESWISSHAGSTRSNRSRSENWIKNLANPGSPPPRPSGSRNPDQPIPGVEGQPRTPPRKRSSRRARRRHAQRENSRPLPPLEDRTQVDPPPPAENQGAPPPAPNPPQQSEQRSRRSTTRTFKPHGPNEVPSEESPSSSGSSDTSSSDSSDKSSRRGRRKSRSRRKSTKIADPEKFEGTDKPQFKHWKSDVLDKLSANKDHYRTETDRMRLVWSVLGGKAKEALFPRYRTTHPDAFKTVKEMMETLAMAYEDPDRLERAKEAWYYCAMRENEPVQQFALRFRNLAADAEITASEQINGLGRKLTAFYQKELHHLAHVTKTKVVDMDLAEVWEYLCHIQTSKAIEEDSEVFRRKVTGIPSSARTAAIAGSSRDVIHPRGIISTTRMVKFTNPVVTHERPRSRSPVTRNLIGPAPASPSTPARAPAPTGACFNCGSQDHFIADCPQPKKTRIHEIDEASDWNGSSQTNPDPEATKESDPKNEKS